MLFLVQNDVYHFDCIRDPPPTAHTTYKHRPYSRRSRLRRLQCSAATATEVVLHKVLPLRALDQVFWCRCLRSRLALLEGHRDRQQLLKDHHTALNLLFR